MKKPSNLPERIFINFINGNLHDAKRTSKRVKIADLFEFVYNEVGWNMTLSMAASNYLKGIISFHNFCTVKEKFSK